MPKSKQSNPNIVALTPAPATVNDLPVDQQVNLIESLLGKIKHNETAIMKMAEENDVIRQKIQKLIAFHSTPKPQVQQVMKALKK